MTKNDFLKMYAERQKCSLKSAAEQCTPVLDCLEAAKVEALQALKEPCKVLLISDSKYVTDGINKGWVEQSKDRGWRKTNKQPFLNSDLWETLLSLMNIHEVTFQWIKGHSSNPENERCDFLATTAYQNI